MNPDKIKKGYLLAPCNPIACFVAGYLDICEGQYEDCFAKLNRAVQLKASFYRDVVRIYVEDLSRPYKAIALASDNIDRLKHLVNVFKDAQYNDLAQQCCSNKNVGLPRQMPLITHLWLEYINS